MSKRTNKSNWFLTEAFLNLSYALLRKLGVFPEIIKVKHKPANFHAHIMPLTHTRTHKKFINLLPLGLGWFFRQGLKLSLLRTTVVSTLPMFYSFTPSDLTPSIPPIFSTSVLSKKNSSPDTQTA